MPALLTRMLSVFSCLLKSCSAVVSRRFRDHAVAELTSTSLAIESLVETSPGRLHRRECELMFLLCAFVATTHAMSLPAFEESASADDELSSVTATK